MVLLLLRPAGQSNSITARLRKQKLGVTLHRLLYSILFTHLNIQKQPGISFSITPMQATLTAYDRCVSQIMDSSLDTPSLPPPRPVIRDSRPPLSAQDWEDQRMTFERLYSAERRSLREVMEILEQGYGFRATYVQCLQFSCLFPLRKSF
jgi:hypothetical protein